jgi:hypothetical protein
LETSKSLVGMLRNSTVREKDSQMVLLTLIDVYWWWTFSPLCSH